MLIRLAPYQILHTLLHNKPLFLGRLLLHTLLHPRPRLRSRGVQFLLSLSPLLQRRVRLGNMTALLSPRPSHDAVDPGIQMREIIHLDASPVYGVLASCPTCEKR